MRRGSRAAAFSASAAADQHKWLSAVRQQQQLSRRQQCPHALQALAALLLLVLQRLRLRLRGKLRRCRHHPHCYVCIDEESVRAQEEAPCF